MKRNSNTWFLALFGLIGILPFVQQVFHPFKLAGLQGAFMFASKPVWSASGFLDGSLQQNCDDYLRENSAFRGDLVRLRNQLDYSLFGNVNTIFTLGKENYIFDPNYIAAREGTDLPDPSALSEKARTVSRAVHVLDSLGVPLIFCFAPNKADYYAEFIDHHSTASAHTIQKYFEPVLKKSGTHVIDFGSWFMQMKSSAPHPLIPKYGAHWSTYGATLAGDSLLKVMNAAASKRFASFSIKGIEVSDQPRFTDDDYLASLNMMVAWKSPSMAYPVLQFSEGPRADVLVISDSFLWNLYDIGLIGNCTSPRSEMWYYNKSAFNNQRGKIGDRLDRVTAEELKGRDAVIIIAHPASLKDFGFGFFDQVSRIGTYE